MIHRGSAVCFVALIAVPASAQLSEANQNLQVPWPTGQVEVLSGAVPCDGEGCEIQVACATSPQPHEPS